MNGSLALDDAAGLAGLRVGFGMAFDDVDVLHDDLVAGDTHNFTFFAFVLFLATDDHYLITFADLSFHHSTPVHFNLDDFRGK